LPGVSRRFLRHEPLSLSLSLSRTSRDASLKIAIPGTEMERAARLDSLVIEKWEIISGDPIARVSETIGLARRLLYHLLY
jgi:hypothetical protein